MEGYHRSVLLKESIEALHIKKGRWYLDCTLGDGGHALEILRRGGKMVGIDVDPQALKRAGMRFGESGYLGGPGLVLIQGNFRDINNLITQDRQTELIGQKFEGVKFHLSGAIFDLGVSSLQLESPQRGFSFGKIGPLDMRMDPNLAIRAFDLVNNFSRKELYEIFKNLGEEKYSWRLADALVFARQVKPFKTTEELAEVVARVVGKRERIHPATRIFQALRMFVNDELGALKEGLEQVINLLETNSRIVVISFHSLEDRLVKNTFKSWEEGKIGEIITKKPVVPTEAGIRENPRARSAKMRVFEKGRVYDYHKKI